MWFGSDLVRLLEVGERLVVLPEVPVHHPLIGEDVGALGFSSSALPVGVDGGLLLLGVEVVVAERDRGLHVLGVPGYELLRDGDPLVDSGPATRDVGAATIPPGGRPPPCGIPPPGGIAPGGIAPGGGMAGTPPAGGAIGAAVTGSFFLHPTTARATARATSVRFKVAFLQGSWAVLALDHAATSSPMAAGFKDGPRSRIMAGIDPAEPGADGGDGNRARLEPGREAPRGRAEDEEDPRQRDRLRPRADRITLYLTCELSRHRALLARLGRHTKGKSCLRLRRLSDVDAAALEELVRSAVAEKGNGDDGEAPGNRTRNHRLKRPMLCQLS